MKNKLNHKNSRIHKEILTTFYRNVNCFKKKFKEKGCEVTKDIDN